MTLATHAEGAAKQVFTRKLINAVYRNIPFGDKPAQLSYQHHLRLALKASRTSDEFISNLQGALNKGHVINTSARVALKELLQDIQNSAENLQKVDKASQHLINNADSKNILDEAKQMPRKHPSQHLVSDGIINQNDLKLGSVDTSNTPNLAKSTGAKQAQANDNSVMGENFVMKDAKQTYPYNAFIDIEQALSKELSLPQPQIRASLQYLYDLHPEMFENKRDVYNTIKELLKFHQYAGNSFKDPNLAYIANKNSDNKMSDMAISRQSGGVIHLNKDKDIRKKDMKIFDEPMAGAVNSQQRQQVSVPQMNTSKEHFSSANDAIIPQKPEISKLINELKEAELNKLNSLQIMGKRKLLESKLNIHPTKEFGENYAEFYHDGIGAVHKLLAEKQGQVAGAFERKELGDIDLVWGDDKFGLCHILKRRSEQWGEQKALKFLSHLDENIKNGQIIHNNEKGTIEIKTPQTTIILAKSKNNNFVLTAYRDRSNKGLETDKFVRSSNFTDKDVEFTAKSKSALLSNQANDAIISQKEQNPKSTISNQLSNTPQTISEIKQSANKRKEAIKATKDAQIKR